MPDPIYADPRLARLYDAFDGPRADLAAYLAIADEVGAGSVLDLGCGTGTLAVQLAAGGRRVVGVDPAEASLDVARAKPGAALVTWVCGLAGDLVGRPASAVDLAVMTGNAVQAVLTDPEWDALLGSVRQLVRPGGTFVFETRRPAARDWERWAGRGDQVRDVPGIGQVTQSFALTEVSLPRVSFRHRYRFPDGHVVSSDSTIRFRDEEEVRADLAASGFGVRAVREAPDRPGLELVFVAEVS